MADRRLRRAAGRRKLNEAARPWFRDPIALAIGLPAFALHLLFANRYDVFRDELYFIVCGRHPAFGYADQPPLVPLLAAGFFSAGAHTWLLRVPAVVAAALLVFLTVRFVRLLGGGDASAVAAGVAAACAPMFLGLFATLNTTVFEPLAWTGIAYLLARAALRDDGRGLVWAGVIAGVAFEAKYALIAWLVALAAGLALTPERRLLARREVWIGVVITIVLAVPSVLWQAANGWPFVELVRAAGEKNVTVPPIGFVLNQVLVMNPLFAPLWIAGIVTPFVRRDLAPARFVAIAFVVVLALTIVSHGKDYYVAAAYPALFAVGAVGLERSLRNRIAAAAYLTAAVAVSAVAAPTSMPILPPAGVPAYMTRMHLPQQQQEKSFAGTALPQEFADELGWHDFVREVGSAYAALPPADRERTAILVDNYGEAAALDVYGAPYNLPPALTGHNQYYFWGRGAQADNLVRVQRHIERLRPYCASVREIATTFSTFAMAYENGKTIAFCRGLKPPLPEIWPKLKDFN